MTLPTVISNHKKKVTVTKLKQSYFIFSQAFAAIQLDYGDTSTWDCYFKRVVPVNSINREEYVTNLEQNVYFLI